MTSNHKNICEWYYLKNSALRSLSENSYVWDSLSTEKSFWLDLATPVTTSNMFQPFLESFLKQNENNSEIADVDIILKLVRLIIGVGASDPHLLSMKPSLLVLTCMLCNSKLLPSNALELISSRELLVLLVSAAEYGNSNAETLLKSIMVLLTVTQSSLDDVTGIIIQNCSSSSVLPANAICSSLSNLLRLQHAGQQKPTLLSLRTTTAFENPLSLVSDECILPIMGPAIFKQYCKVDKETLSVEESAVEIVIEDTGTALTNDSGATAMNNKALIDICEKIIQLRRLYSDYATQGGDYASQEFSNYSGSVAASSGSSNPTLLNEARLDLLHTSLAMLQNNLESMALHSINIHEIIHKSSIVPLDMLDGAVDKPADSDAEVRRIRQKEANISFTNPLPSGFQLVAGAATGAATGAGAESIRFPNGPIHLVSDVCVPSSDSSGDVIAIGKWVFRHSGNNAFGVGITGQNSNGGQGPGLTRGFINSGCTIPNTNTLTGVSMANKIIELIVNSINQTVSIKVDNKETTINLNASDFPCKLCICGYNATLIQFCDASGGGGSHGGRMSCMCGHGLGLVPFPLDPGYYHLGSCRWTCCGNSWQETICSATSSREPAQAPPTQAKKTDMPGIDAGVLTADMASDGLIQGKNECKQLSSSILEAILHEVSVVICCRAVRTQYPDATLDISMYHRKGVDSGNESIVSDVDDLSLEVSCQIIRLLLMNGMVKLLWSYLFRNFVFRFAVMARTCLSHSFSAVNSCSISPKSVSSATALLAIREIEKVAALFNSCLSFAMGTLQTSFFLDASIDMNQQLNSPVDIAATLDILGDYVRTTFHTFVSEELINGIVLPALLHKNNIHSQDNDFSQVMQDYLRRRHKRGIPLRQHPCWQLLNGCRSKVSASSKCKLEAMWLQALSRWMSEEFLIFFESKQCGNRDLIITLNRLCVTARECLLLEYGSLDLDSDLPTNSALQMLSQLDDTQICRLSYAAAEVSSDLLSCHSQVTKFEQNVLEIVDLEKELQVIMSVVKLLASSTKFSRFGYFCDKFLARRLLSHSSISFTFEKQLIASIGGNSIGAAIMTYVQSTCAAAATCRKMMLRSLDRSNSTVPKSCLQIALHDEDAGFQLLLLGTGGMNLLDINAFAAKTLILPSDLQAIKSLADTIVSSNSLSNSFAMEQIAIEALKLPQLPVGSRPEAVPKKPTQEDEIPPSSNPPSTSLKLQWLHDVSTVTMELSGLSGEPAPLFLSLLMPQAVILLLIAKCKDGLTLPKIAELSGMSNVDVSRHVDTLCSPSIGALRTVNSVITVNYAFFEALASRHSDICCPVSLIPAIGPDEIHATVIDKSHWSLVQREMKRFEMNQKLAGDRSKEGLGKGLSFGNQAGGHCLRLLDGSERCSKCGMYGPSQETSSQGCKNCLLCATCCAGRNPCIKADYSTVTKLASRHNMQCASRTFSGFGAAGVSGDAGICPDCKKLKSDYNSCSRHSCTKCQRCAPCAVMYPYCTDVLPVDNGIQLSSLGKESSAIIERSAVNALAKVCIMQKELRAATPVEHMKLFSADAVKLLLFREFRKLSQQMRSTCRIALADDDVFTWKLQYFGFGPESSLQSDMSSCANILGIDFIEIGLIFPCEDYPLCGPSVSIIRPQLINSIALMHSLSPVTIGAKSEIQWSCIHGLGNLLSEIHSRLQQQAKVDLSPESVGYQLDGKSAWLDLCRQLSMLRYAKDCIELCSSTAAKEPAAARIIPALSLVSSSTLAHGRQQLASQPSTPFRNEVNFGSDSDSDSDTGSRPPPSPRSGFTSPQSPVGKKPQPAVKDTQQLRQALSMELPDVLISLLVPIQRSLQEIVPWALEQNTMPDLVNLLSSSCFLSALHTSIKSSQVLNQVTLELVELLVQVPELSSIRDHSSSEVGATTVSELIPTIESVCDKVRSKCNEHKLVISKLLRDKNTAESQSLQDKLRDNENLLAYAAMIIAESKVAH